jgi:hypothetical protein
MFNTKEKSSTQEKKIREIQIRPNIFSLQPRLVELAQREDFAAREAVARVENDAEKLRRQSDLEEMYRHRDEMRRDSQMGGERRDSQMGGNVGPEVGSLKEFKYYLERI